MYYNKLELPELLRSVKGDAYVWDRDTCACAKVFYSVLQELYFNSCWIYSHVCTTPQCYKQRYLKYFRLLLQCSRGQNHVGFRAVSVGSWFPEFYPLTLQNILEGQ